VTAPRWEMRKGDSMVALLRDTPDELFDAVITDPPYSSGGNYRGDRVTNNTNAKYQNSETEKTYPEFFGDTRDQRGFLAWSTLWLAECWRCAKPGAVIEVFTDWRQLPQTTDALQAGGWVWRGVVPWDKVWARPQRGRFAQVAEFIVWGSKGPLADGEIRGVGCLPGVYYYDASNAHDLDPPSIWRQPIPSDEKFHTTGKPIALLRDMAKLCIPGGLVFDPFAGSGTTGIGALESGRRFVGYEIGAEYFELARDRLAAAERGLQLDDARAGQLGLFGA
jgi:site-specific DNA-methyltransferase (adenine-specific)